MRTTTTNETWQKFVKCSYKERNFLGIPVNDEIHETSCVAVLNIPKGTQVYSERDHHRAEEADIQDIYIAETKNGNKTIEEAWSNHDSNIKYVKGQTIVADSFSQEDYMNEPGIHGYTPRNAKLF